jgi:hypothetical protein
MDDIIVIDDCISKNYQDFVEKELFAEKVPWVFLKDVTYDVDTTKYHHGVHGFQHSVFTGDEGVVSSAHWFLYPILLEACAKEGREVSQLFRIRVGLYVNSGTSDYNNVHTDSDFHHWVGLYYINDADGDTVFFENDRATERHRIAPKKGSFVLFDGSIPHASSNPVKQQYRTTVNFNFV